MALALIQCHSLCEHDVLPSQLSMGRTFLTSHSSTGIYHICEQGHHHASYCTVSYGALQIRLMPEVFRLALLGQRLSCKALPTDAWAEHGDFQSFPTATCGLVKQLAPSFPPSSATAFKCTFRGLFWKLSASRPFSQSLGLWTAKECTDASTRIANPARGEGATLCFCENHRTRCNSRRCKPLDFLGSLMLWTLASGRLAVVSVVVYLEQP